jgi:hypothetical protein
MLNKVDNLVRDFFKDRLIPLFMMLVPDVKNRFSTKHYKNRMTHPIQLHPVSFLSQIKSHITGTLAGPTNVKATDRC